MAGRTKNEKWQMAEKSYAWKLSGAGGGYAACELEQNLHPFCTRYDIADRGEILTRSISSVSQSQ